MRPYSQFGLFPVIGLALFPLSSSPTSVSTAPPSVPQTTGGAGPIQNSVDCADTVRDAVTGQCIEVSSIPQLGQLVPMTPNLFINPNTGRVGLGTVNPVARLHVNGTLRSEQEFRAPKARIGDLPINNFNLSVGGPLDASLLLQADNDNNGEGDQPSIWMTQDGGIVQGRLGMFDDANDLVLQHMYRSADIFFRVVDTGATGQRREFEWQNTSLSGVATDTEMRLTANGDLQIDGTLSSPAADVAEFYPVSAGVAPGDVVAFTGEGLELSLADSGNAARLAGVVSSKPGVTLGVSYTDESDTGETIEFEGDEARFEGEGEFRVDLSVRHEIEVNRRAPLALTGRVPVKVSAENGAIRPGDHLTVSSIPGRAAKAVEAGPVIGTALGSWDAGEGVILVLANRGWYSPDAGHELAAMTAALRALDRRVSELEAR